MSQNKQQSRTSFPLGSCAIHTHNLRARGFTLVELLVTIAIIALLIAVLLPSLRKARAQAKRLVCQANLHQIAVAWDGYLQSNDGRFLQGINVNVNFGGQQGVGNFAYGGDAPGTTPVVHEPIRKVLNPYLRLPEVAWDGTEVFRCPADKGSLSYGPTFHEYYGNSYIANHMLIDQDRLPVPPFPQPMCRKPLLEEINTRLPELTLSRVTVSPAMLILAGGHGGRPAYSYNDPQRIEWHEIKHSHNLAFLDGHAAFTRIRKGLDVTSEYTVLPFRDLHTTAAACHEEVIDD